MSEELKGCPFCGGEPELNYVGRNSITIRCRSCNISRKQKVLRQTLEWLEQKMIENWNRRAPATEVDEALNDFVKLARFSDGWNSYDLEQFREFRKREVELAAMAKPEEV